MGDHIRQSEDGAEDLPDLLSHMSLINSAAVEAEASVLGAPIFTEYVRRHARQAEGEPFKQYGLLGADLAKMASSIAISDSPMAAESDPRVFYNVAAPASVFVCGSQGSGKSHTLSCILENCLLPSEASVLPRPLTGIVFHYDTFVSESGGSPCEAAYLASSEDVQVRVLCPPTNVAKIKELYSKLPRVTVEELRLDESDLNTKRMLDLMAVSSIQGGAMPLYLHVVTRILRDLRITQQQLGGAFNYREFRDQLKLVDLTPGQMAPLNQRLDTLESFMPKQQVAVANFRSRNHGAASAAAKRQGNLWTPKPGQLTIIDLSCPCITQEAACALFNICLSLFLEQDSKVGRVIALDEAHKYMTESTECATLTETLLATIRLQRHLGTRVVVSTQEPTVCPKLLDLCSITVVHRFTSPDWFRSLRQHLAGANNLAQGMDEATGLCTQSEFEQQLLSQILGLRTGEGLLFSPSALVAVGSSTVVDLSGPRDESRATVKLACLGSKPLKIRIRKRITDDGGQTIMAK